MLSRLFHPTRRNTPRPQRRTLLSFEQLDNRIVPTATPIAVADAFSTLAAGRITAAAPGVLANDTNPSGGSLCAMVNSMPAHGSLNFSSNGSFVYTPWPGFVGTDSFSYSASSGMQSSAPVSVSLNVNLSVANVQTLQASEGTALNTVVANFTSLLPNAVAGDFAAQIDWGDGQVSAGLITATGANTFSVAATHTYACDGPSLMRVTVTDAAGNSDDSVSQIMVQNLAPIVNAGQDQTVSEGQPVTLTGSYTDPGIHDTHTRNWSVYSSNGQSVAGGTGNSLSFTPTDNGTYMVIFQVVDDRGAMGMDTVQVNVTNVVPTLVISGAAQVNEGTPYMLELEAGADPGTDTIYSWTINWGDGSPVMPVMGNPDSVSHVYSRPGNFLITASASDEDGSYSAASGQAVNVLNVAPVIELSLSSVLQRMVTLTGRVLDASPQGLTVTFSGQVTATTTTDINGNFTLTAQAAALGQIFATASDSGGLTSNQAQVTVTSQAPTFLYFHVMHEVNDVWVVSGKVQDESLIGMTVILSGMGNLNNVSVVIQSDGTFSHAFQLTSPNETGTVVARVTDCWGLTAEDYELICPGSQ